MSQETTFPDKALPVHHRRYDSTNPLLKTQGNGANAGGEASNLTTYTENITGGANVNFERSNIRAFGRNSASFVEAGRQKLRTPSSPEDATSGSAPPHIPSAVSTPNPAYLRTCISDISKTHPIGLHQEGHYVPDDMLRNLLTGKTIREALGQGVEDRLVKYVLEKAPKTFAILQLVFSEASNRKLAMQTFQRTSFTDETLETEEDLDVCALSPCTKDKRQQAEHLQGKQVCSHFFPFPNPWDDVTLSNFKIARWKFLIPTFDHLQFRYEFDTQRLLPFRAKGGSDKPSSGNFSEVVCVDMLADKQTILPQPLPATIAVAHKTLRQLDAPKFDIRREWIREADAHRQLNGISDHLVKGIAAYHRKANSKENDTYHIVLEWADGSNLFNFWNKNHEPQLDANPKRSRDRMRMMLEQLYGLAHAVECMHTEVATLSTQESGDLPVAQNVGVIVNSNADSPVPALNIERPLEDTSAPARRPDPVRLDPDRQSAGLAVPGVAPRKRSRRASNAKNWRHGDIKPENILRFTGGNPSVWLGTLKLADLGRAQQHDLKTSLRDTIEKERWRTRFYEPPDLSEDLHQQAHGKISRLFDIWSMGCVIFESVIWLLYGSSEILRFQKMETGNTGNSPYWRKLGRANYQVTTRASLWMEHILQHDSKQVSAIGDLIKLVRDKLLKVDLPPDSDVYTPGKRTNARDMTKELARILKKAKEEPVYLFDGVDKFGPHPPPVEISTPIQQFSKSPDYLSVPIQNVPKQKRQADQSLAMGHRTRISEEKVYTDGLTDSWQYPDDHQFAQEMIAEDQIPHEDNMCDHCTSIDMTSTELVFEKASLEIGSEYCALCDLIKKAIDRVDLPAGDELHLQRDSDCLIVSGTSGSKLKILRLCCPDQKTSESLANVPVGAPSLYDPPRIPRADDAFMRLPRKWLKECDDKHGDACAATHDRSHLPLRLVDLRSKRPKIVDAADIKQDTGGVRYIAFSHKWGEMPEGAKTTKSNLDAPGGRRTAIPNKFIPQSFADAIAITRALGCDYLWIDCLCINQGKDGDFAQQANSMQAVFSNAYCVIAAASAEGAVDGFLERDVEKNPLDAVKVGKVDEVDFLGDSHFPSKAIRSKGTRGEQIHLWTALFKQYTRLGFSHKEDRPVAIQGLMDRLTSAFKKRSHAGVFESFWGRCLLWQRAQEVPALTWIPPGEHTKKLPPSWSWMAVDGPIDFLQPKGGGVEWKEADIVLPFPKQSMGSSLQPNPQSLPTTNGNATSDTIRATAFDFKTGVGDMTETILSYDDGRNHVNGEVKCIIVATKLDKANHYVLLVSSAVHTTSATHERVGVAYLPESFIDRTSGAKVTIG
ncbi:hypothetical protein E8E11_003748 [Didymella keratinophila]|nr:hypothetical protein E8E11_003748 [Didymella keratinophila]